MKITNNAIGYVIQFCQEIGQKHLPQRISYALARNVMGLQKNYDLYMEQMKKLFDKYNDFIEKDGDGNLKYTENGIPIVDNEHKGEFMEELQELAGIDVDVEMYKIDADLLNYDNDKYDTLTVREILDLEKLICEAE